MNYAEMIAACERAGHDMTAAKAHLTTKAAPTAPTYAAPLRSDVIMLSLDEVAGVLDAAIAAEVEPLARRLDEFETRLANVEGELQKFVPKPRAVG